MKIYRSKILPLMGHLGFVGRDGVSPSISALETRLARAGEERELVYMRIGQDEYSYQPVTTPQAPAPDVIEEAMGDAG